MRLLSLVLLCALAIAGYGMATKVHRVQALTDTGTFVSKFGTYGNWDYHFPLLISPLSMNYPSHIAYNDTDGNLYITIGANPSLTDRVLVATTGGVYVRSIYANPYDVRYVYDVVTEGTLVYVVVRDQNRRAIFIWNTAGLFQDRIEFGITGWNGSQNIGGIAIWNNYIVVGVKLNTAPLNPYYIYVFNKTAPFAYVGRKLIINSFSYSEFYPTDVTTGYDGNLYLLANALIGGTYQSQVYMTVNPLSGGTIGYGWLPDQYSSLTDDATKLYLGAQNGTAPVDTFTRAMAPISSLAAWGTGNGQFGLCNGIVWHDNKLYTVDWNVAAPPDVATDVDNLFGFHHIVHTDAGGSGLAHTLKPLAGAMEVASAVAADAVKPGVKVLPDGRLMVVYEDSAGAVQTLYSYDLGEHWS